MSGLSLPKRQNPRLPEFDYSQTGVYFVTICTQNRAQILSHIVPTVGPDALIGPTVRLTPIGKILEQYILRTELVYPNVIMEKYVIMPNHVHLLIRLTGDGPMGASGPTISQIIKGIKGLTTREIGCSVFQTSFHDHIIRDEQDFLTRWEYFDQNPAKWAEDEYFAGSEVLPHE